MSNEIHALPEPWSSFFRELDRIASERVDFHCIGGFVVTRYYGFARETADVDVLSIVPNAQREAFLQAGAAGSPLHRKLKVYLDYVTVIHAYPEDYDQRLIEIFPGQLQNIRIFAPEAHDLALMKLGRNIERDREDVKYLARRGYLTGEELENRYRLEMRPYIGVPDSSDRVLKFWLDMIREELVLNNADSDSRSG
jgi:hypothetical protein